MIDGIERTLGHAGVAPRVERSAIGPRQLRILDRNPPRGVVGRQIHLADRRTRIVPGRGVRIRRAARIGWRLAMGMSRLGRQHRFHRRQGGTRRAASDRIDRNKSATCPWRRTSARPLDPRLAPGTVCASSICVRPRNPGARGSRDSRSAVRSRTLEDPPEHGGAEECHPKCA